MNVPVDRFMTVRPSIMDEAKSTRSWMIEGATTPCSDKAAMAWTVRRELALAWVSAKANGRPEPEASATVLPTARRSWGARPGRDQDEIRQGDNRLDRLGNGRRGINDCKPELGLGQRLQLARKFFQGRGCEGRRFRFARPFHQAARLAWGPCR